jgi:RNA polymerase sigma factor (TIGR02999 family)|tara:strand:+ start:321 stop:908 length:588 start_codon:yes stop_codon:yes gene_type:complete
MDKQKDVTQMLDAVAQGDDNAASELWEAVHREVHQMAINRLSRERKTANLQPTMIVNEVYMRMWPKDKEPPNWENRRHFFGSIARVMEQFLIDYARKRNRLKRGGDRKRVSLTMADGELSDLATVDGEALELLVEAIRRLSNELPQAAEVVRLRYIAGFTVKQTAAALDIETRQVAKDWDYARAWLRRELKKVDS